MFPASNACRSVAISYRMQPGAGQKHEEMREEESKKNHHGGRGIEVELFFFLPFFPPCYQGTKCRSCCCKAGSRKSLVRGSMACRWPSLPAPGKRVGCCGQRPDPLRRLVSGLDSVATLFEQQITPVFFRMRAMPKSPSLMTSRLVRKMFWVLRSRCRILRSCTCFRARQSCTNQSRIWSSGKFTPFFTFKVQDAR
jgi:hypothetical protein